MSRAPRPRAASTPALALLALLSASCTHRRPSPANARSDRSATTAAKQPASPPARQQQSKATTPRPSRLWRFVPRDAAAALVARAALFDAPLSLLRGDATLRATVARYLEQAVGADASAMRGALVVARALDSRRALALVVDGVSSGRVKGAPSGGYRDVVWRRVRGTELSAAALHGALLVGRPPLLRWLIDHIKSKPVPRASGRRSASALVAATLRSPALRRAALALVVRVSKVSDMRARILRGLYGGELAMMALELGGAVRLWLRGDANKLKALVPLAQPLLRIGMRRLARARDHAISSQSMTRALAAIVAHRIAELWQPKLRPRMTADGALLSSVSFLPVAKLAAPQWLPTLAAMLAIAAPVAASAATAVSKRPPRLLERARAALTIYRYRLRRRGARFRFPASSGWAPANGCCDSADKRCHPRYRQQALRALRLAASATPYQLRVISRGRGATAFARVEARSDLDCDGRAQTEALEVSIGADGELVFRYIPAGSHQQ